MLLGRPASRILAGDFSQYNSLSPSSRAELSKLLNPARANQGEVKQSPESLRNSDSFTGLVRHVIELGVEGEVPTAWDDEAEQEGAGEGPLGCAIEYSFRDGHVSTSTIH